MIWRFKQDAIWHILLKTTRLSDYGNQIVIIILPLKPFFKFCKNKDV